MVLRRESAIDPKADITQCFYGCSEPLAAGILLRQGAPVDRGCLHLRMKKVAVASFEPQRDL
jgi:hypothetical protein